MSSPAQQRGPGTTWERPGHSTRGSSQMEAVQGLRPWAQQAGRAGKKSHDCPQIRWGDRRTGTGSVRHFPETETGRDGGETLTDTPHPLYAQWSLLGPGARTRGLEAGQAVMAHAAGRGGAGFVPASASPWGSNLQGCRAASDPGGAPMWRW